MKKWLIAVLGVLFLSGCARYSPVPELPEEEETAASSMEEGESEEGLQVIDLTSVRNSKQKPVKVKGIYISSYMAGSEQGMQNILSKVDQTEINAVVIDVKDDEGRITFTMEGAPTVTEIGATKRYIKDIKSLIRDLKSKGIYIIARIVAFRDPYLAEMKPEWSLRDAKGAVHRDNKGLAWVNPYKREVWDYLVEVGTEAARVGFDEIQFDYIRFATDSTMKNVVIEEADTLGRTRTEIITEFITYAYEQLTKQGVFVSADVFGAIIGSDQDSDSVGQIYEDMAENLDYICPMIYPSHYGNGNFGIEHPDKQPYDTILAALQGSKENLLKNKEEGKKQAIVRPWLQDFTATYLKDHIKYGPEEVRAEIQAVYDAGYDEWILWSASNKYTWDALLTQEEAEAQAESIAASREASEQSETSETE